MKIIAPITLIALSILVVAISVCSPTVLSQNEFLKGFVTHEILGMMAVIMTISIATIATIHIWFNELETKHATKVFGPSRREINQSAILLIVLFLLQLLVLIVRSLPVFDGNDVALSIFNGSSLVLLVASVLTLWDVMGVVRALTPED